MSEVLMRLFGAIGFVVSIIVVVLFVWTYIFLVLAVKEVWAKVCGREDEKQIKEDK